MVSILALGGMSERLVGREEGVGDRVGEEQQEANLKLIGLFCCS